SDLPDDGLISEDEAVAPEDCMITQETLDALIADFSAEPQVEDTPEAGTEEGVEPGEDAPPESDPEQLEQGGDSDSGDEAETESDPLDELDIISLDEEELGQGDSDSGEKEVTQEDIDALLMENDEGAEELENEDDILISQDDIDTLLMAADQEDEDVLGDLMGDIEDTGLDDDLDDDELFDADDSLDDSGDEIILEEADGGAPEVAAPQGGGRQWFKSKFLLAAITVALVLGISVPLSYFLFFSSDKDPNIADEMAAAEYADPAPAVPQVASVRVNTDGVAAPSESGTLLLADFVILASDQSKEMTYITTDVSIDYSDQRAYHEISNNMSYYRGLIYEAIQKNLSWEKRDQVTESDLIWEIESTLKKVLPSHYIEKISFKSFKTT
ncbi:MAG: hypothetical protein MI747_00340, partial [Desulfobacterales bacterium]|nr:hypothetical protein [Desulfobacterales bacterium]